jgi:hypothetical protein
MDKKYFLGYSFVALSISNIHLHYIFIDAWKQRNKLRLEDSNNNCYWSRVIQKYIY